MTRRRGAAIVYTRQLTALISGDLMPSPPPELEEHL